MTRLRTFLSFITEDKAHPKNRKVGIQYINNLDTDLFVYAVKNLSKFRATEKMDGVALTTGIDHNGRLFTSRSTKGNERKVYKSEEWGMGGASNVFKVAHAALEANIKLIKSVLSEGESVIIEIILGDQPNAIIYGKDDKSYIIFLKSGDDTDMAKVDQLGHALADAEVTTNTLMIDTSDGLSTHESERSHTWRFMTPEYIPSDTIKSIPVNGLVDDLEAYLKANNDLAYSLGIILTNREVAEISLTGIGKEHKDTIKFERERVKDNINDIKEPIINKLMAHLVSKISPRLQKDDPIVPLGIEGVVFQDLDTGLEFKLVDQNEFAATNRFFHRVRNMVKSSVRTDKADAQLSSRGGIFGDGKSRIANLINVDGMAQPRNIKRILTKFQGDTVNDTVRNFVSSIHESNFHAVKRKSIAICDNIHSELTRALKTFDEDHKNYKLTLSSGKIVKYTDEIVRRTRMTFAEAFRATKQLQDDLMNTHTMEDFIIVMFGAKLKQIHEPSEK